MELHRVIASQSSDEVLVSLLGLAQAGGLSALCDCGKVFVERVGAAPVQTRERGCLDFFYQAANSLFLAAPEEPGQTKNQSGEDKKAQD